MQDLPLDLAMHATIDPVLVVEDNRLNQMVALLLLERLGVPAEVVKNGLEALDAVRRKHFSLILMDCHMPEMDGFECSQAIRKMEEVTGTHTPIIAVTALAMPNDKERCLGAGMDDYIAKPIERELLKAKIDRWLLAPHDQQKSDAATLLAAEVVPEDGVLLPEDTFNFEEQKEFYGEKRLALILQEFTAETELRMAQLEEFIHNRNALGVSGLALTLKSKCTGLGARHMGRLCLYLQMAAINSDWPEAVETFSSLQRSFARDRQCFLAYIATQEKKEELEQAALEQSETAVSNGAMRDTMLN